VIVRRLSEMMGTDREVRGETWTSRRLLLRDDKMGFSLHDTVLGAGTRTVMEYHSHLEAVYCIQGRATLTSRRTGETWEIEPGTVYALNENDPHVLDVHEEIRVVCVFNPPLVGDETHDARGGYSLPDDNA